MKKRTKKRMKLSTRRAWFGALCVSPFILGFLTMTMSPILLYIVIGFHKVMSGDNGIALISVGWQNYIDLFYTEVDFLENVASSLGNMFLNGLFIVIFSLLIATVLNQRFRGRGFARAVLFLPVVIASGVAAMCMNDSLVDSAWAALMTVASSDSLDPERFNLIDEFLTMVGLSFGESFFQLLNDLIARFYTIVLSSGVQILIFLAGLQTISPSLYEAANIDGATAWESYWRITFPMISPMILVNAVYTVIDQLNNTDNIIINTLYQYSGEGTKYGLSSAMGTVYFSLVFLAMGIVFFFISRFVVYEDR